MECGLSSIPTTQDRDRPTDLRRHHDTRKGNVSQPYQEFSNKMQIDTCLHDGTIKMPFPFQLQSICILLSDKPIGELPKRH
jgi:hypothetical protein